MADDLCRMTIHGLHELLKTKKISAVEAAQSVFDRITVTEESLNAYVTLLHDQARQQARAADQSIQQGSCGPLTGIPLAVKDILCTAGIPTTCGSKMLRHFIPPYDATVISTLKAQQAVFCGKANMDEFAMGSTNETSFFGPCRNPWDSDRIPGGSSGGSAAAVAADACIAALGTDTGGSIRQPAAYCGTVGLKPTYGRVSRFGLIAFASSLDQIGPVTKDVEDAAILLNLISGHDPRDSTSVDIAVPDYTGALKKDARGLTIGIPKEYFIDGLDPEVEKAVRDAIAELERQGARLKDISLPHTEHAVAVYYLIAPAEAGSNLARYDGVRYSYRAADAANLQDMYEKSRSEGFGPEVKRRIMIGTYALSAGYYDAYYKKASQVRTLIRRDFETAFKECDVIITPTVPTPAYRIGEKLDDPLSMYLGDVFTVPASLAGLPGISVPCGFSSEGLPIGLQVLGDLFQEEKILHCAYCFEQHTDWHTRKPSL
ncbi:MAG: Asp-tRNA(Asn)/Glu-tRNA(Gln) amidotransferase subunit GatA [Deltaproteobacteria bacterium]|nr:Asp-tRNA(Asn)/Glu-tRNA(Gln) amidotransferase subunit GatA [Deltaproteobacteria bacterium]